MGLQRLRQVESDGEAHPRNSADEQRSLARARSLGRLAYAGETLGTFDVVTIPAEALHYCDRFPTLRRAITLSRLTSGPSTHHDCRRERFSAPIDFAAILHGESGVEGHLRGSKKCVVDNAHGDRLFEFLEQRLSLAVSRDRGLVPSLTGLNLQFARGDVAPRMLRGAQSVCSDFARWSRTARRTDGTDESLQMSNARLLGRGVCGDRPHRRLACARETSEVSGMS